MATAISRRFMTPSAAGTAAVEASAAVVAHSCMMPFAARSAPVATVVVGTCMCRAPSAAGMAPVSAVVVGTPAAGVMAVGAEHHSSGD